MFCTKSMCAIFFKLENGVHNFYYTLPSLGAN